MSLQTFLNLLLFLAVIATTMLAIEVAIGGFLLNKPNKKLLLVFGSSTFAFLSFHATNYSYWSLSLVYSSLIVLFFIYPFTKLNSIFTICLIMAISTLLNPILYVFNFYSISFNNSILPLSEKASHSDFEALFKSIFTSTNESPDRGDFGVLGDFFGGVFNPILSFASLVLLLGTFFINLKELKETREEMKKQSEQMEKQTKLVEEQTKLTSRQTIDTFYFELIKRHDNLLENAVKEYREVMNTNPSCLEAKNKLHKKSVFVNYIGQLNKILLFIEKNKDISDKEYYLGLLNILQNQEASALIAISCYGQENSPTSYNKEYRDLVTSNIIKKDENVFYMSLLETKKQECSLTDEFIISLLVDFKIATSHFDNQTRAAKKIINLESTAQSAPTDENLFSLGDLYYIGEEISADYEKAFRYFNQSHKLNPNNDTAKFWLASCYLNGHGTQKNLEEARKLYKQIKDNQNSNIKLRLRELAEKLYQQTELQITTLSGVDSDILEAYGIEKTSTPTNKKQGFNSLGLTNND